MTDTLQLRPELMVGPNPFIEALPPYLTVEQVMRQLSRFPLDKVPWQALPAESRIPLLSFAESHYVVTRLILKPVLSVQTMLRSSMVQRNPLRPGERQRCAQIGIAQSPDAIARTPCLNSSSGIIKGVTAMGKSSLVRRALELFAPQQLIDYGASSAGGWLRLKQAAWLWVDHPSNGTRGALLKRILLALDECLGTDWSDQYARVSNIDVLLTQVAKQLSLHRVALLVIDESQARNLADSPWRVEFVLFYLSLMNLGVSVLLIGNPKAFEFLQIFAQVVRRFSTGGIHLLEPAASPEEPWWKADFVPRARKFSLVDDVAIDPELRAKFEWEHCAGIPGLYQQLQLEAQRAALHRDRTSAKVSLILEDFEAALQSPGYQGMDEIARQVHARGVQEPTMEDLPETAESTLPAEFRLPDALTAETLKRLAHNLKRSQAVNVKRFVAQIDELHTLTPEQREMLGVREDLLTSAKAIRSELGGSPAKARGKKK